MIHRYKDVSIIYGGRGRRYAEALNERLTKISTDERYPIRATIINETILTCELLADVMKLFKESEFCVAFLTAEDCCITDHGEKRRLRQNVVFELGMALIELGRERCILLSDFDVKGSDFDLPSDMNSLEILQFDAVNLEKILSDIVDKLLKLSQESIVAGIVDYTVPKYDHLITRVKYRVDYENIFVDRPLTLASEGKDFINDTLIDWINECKSLPYYDEKCIYLLERMGFLPIFGRTPSAIQFMESAEALISYYQPKDIEYYNDTQLLDFAKNVVQCVIDYTLLKTRTISDAEIFRGYKKLLQRMLCISHPDLDAINPLISVVYYDYLGLTYYRLFKKGQNENELQSAKTSFLKAEKYAEAVDSGMNVWKGFLYYNMARVFTDCNDPDNAQRFFTDAERIREMWVKTKRFNITVRNALSFEYFICKINQIDMQKKFQVITLDEAQIEYSYVEKELNAYSDIDDKLDQLIYIRQLLEDRKQEG